MNDESRRISPEELEEAMIHAVDDSPLVVRMRERLKEMRAEESAANISGLSTSERELLANQHAEEFRALYEELYREVIDLLFLDLFDGSES